jgi:SAM-dependent methyltransferase
VTFDVAADSYGRFMGRYSEQLAAQFVDRAGIIAGQQALDVGCGPGAVTAVLVERLGADRVCAVEPSAPFLDAVRARLPQVEVRQSSAKHLPYDDDRFDAAVAQLVVHFMTDPVAGLREMARVTRPGGVVTACVWDYAGERSPLSAFWQVVRALDPDAPTEAHLAGARAGHLEELFEAAGLKEVRGGELEVRVRYESFEEWWAPYLLGVGPAGDHVQALDETAREHLREGCRAALPEPPFDVHATAWCATGVVP